jgi:hypothetical protein
MYRLTIILSILTTVPVFAQTEPCPASHAYEYIKKSVFQDTTTIYHRDTFYNKIIRQGDGYIFRYVLNSDCPNVADDEMLTTIKWSIPDYQKSFRLVFNSNDRQPQNIFYSSMNTPLRIKAYGMRVTGVIEGSKNENTWNIKGELLVSSKSKGQPSTTERTISFAGEFKEWDQGTESTKKAKKIPKEFF